MKEKFYCVVHLQPEDTLTDIPIQDSKVFRDYNEALEWIADVSDDKIDLPKREMPVRVENANGVWELWICHRESEKNFALNAHEMQEISQ